LIPLLGPYAQSERLDALLGKATLLRIAIPSWILLMREYLDAGAATVKG
jgi:hypothetical protein